MTKKIIAMLATLVMLLSLVGCGGDTAQPQETAATRSSRRSVVDDDVEKNPAPILTVSGGGIQGYYSDDNTVRVYKGIPYAEAERFKAPTATSWEGVWDCTDWGPSCIQDPERPMAAYTAEFMGSSDTYSENCLNLNVWTANNDETGKPVIVYIHGGGYTAGNASCKVYEGKSVAQKGVVYVSINYRLGLFGFFATDELVEEDPAAAGNYAILDQIAALKWVQENIEQFGGDPDNVTIMGQSAGGGSVNMLLVSPLSEGLFRRAVTMSHNSVANDQFKLCTQSEKVEEFKTVMEDKDIPERTLAEMRAMTDEEFFEAYHSVWLVDVAPVEPCIDGTVIPDTIANCIAGGMAHDVDHMIGTTSNDLGGNVEGVDDPIEALTGETALFAYARALGGYSGKTYTYIFTHEMPGKRPEGAFHTSDVPYFLSVFSNLRAEYWTENDYRIGDMMSDYLVNFARTGDPNGSGLTEWPANASVIDSIDFSYMRLDLEAAQGTTGEAAQACVLEQYAGLIDSLLTVSGNAGALPGPASAEGAGTVSGEASGDTA